jgi:cytochrome c553
MSVALALRMESSSPRLRAAVIVFVCFGACAHREPPAPQGAASSRTAANSPGTAAPAPAAAQPAAAADAQTLESYMLEHFLIANYARDAVITGRLDALRRALKALSEYDYAHVATGDAQPWIAKLQLAAKPGATATSQEEAARAIADVAVVCGQCHAARGTGPVFPNAYDADSDMGLANTLGDRMERHVWAANRMWEGLIGPSDQAWRAGSAELASVPLKAPRHKPALSAEFAAELRQLRELGDHARSSTESAERAQVYARLLVHCARCHDREGAAR